MSWRSMTRLACLFLLSAFLALPAEATTRSVKSNCTGIPSPCYTTVRAAILAASSGDSVIVYSGTYTGDHVTVPVSNLIVRGLDPRPVLSAGGSVEGDKGIWVIPTGVTNLRVENLEFTGATSSGFNGAGIRLDPYTTGYIAIKGCYFHDNQTNILGNRDSMSVTYTELNHGGTTLNPTPGQAHNIYVSGGRVLSFRYNYSHNMNTGNLVKTRASVNYIEYNRITDESAGTASYEIDVPDCGRTYIMGNVIEKGPGYQNPNLVRYGAESANNGTQDLYLINNTLVNNSGSGSTVFCTVRSGTTVKNFNNIFYGSGTTMSATGSSVISSTNFTGTSGAGFNSPGSPNYDYRLTSTTPATIVNFATTPGVATGGYNLTPNMAYVYDTDSQARSVSGSALDIGAFEYVTSGGVPITYQPVLAQPSNMTVNENSTADQVITATDADGQAISFFLYNIHPYLSATVTTVVPGVGTATGNIHLAPGYTDSGTYLMKINIRDSAGMNGTDIKQLTITVNDVGRPPSFAQPDNMIVTEGATADQSLFATDPDSGGVTFSKVSGNALASVSTVSSGIGNLHLAPSVGDAVGSPYTIVVRASDLADHTDKTLSVVVLPAAVDSRCVPF